MRTDSLFLHSPAFRILRAATLLLAVLCCLSSISLSRASEQPSVRKVLVEPDRLLAPDPRAFRCAFELEGFAYDESATQRCLQRMLASGYVESGTFSVKKEGNGQAIVFQLKPVQIRLAAIEFEGVPEQEANDLRAFLTSNQGYFPWLFRDWPPVKPGDPYAWSEWQHTLVLVERFLESKGQDVLVTPVLHLNYAERTWKLVFRILDDPRGKLEPALPAVISCKVFLTRVVWEDVDRFVPPSLFKRLSRLSPRSCYSKDLIEEDLAEARASGLLSRAEYRLSGAANYKEVRLIVRARPIVVRSLTVVATGILAGREIKVPGTPLQVGEVYERRAANQLRTLLEEQNQAPELEIRVIEDAKPSASAIDLVYYVLAAPRLEIFINGERIPQLPPAPSRTR